MNKPTDRTTNIPVTQAYTLQNKNDKYTHHVVGSEFVGSITINAETKRGKYWTFPINPVSELFGKTRLRQLAGSYDKFRFKKLQLQVACNFSTTVGGNIIAGYSENPEIQILNGDNIFNQVYALNGVSANLWAPVTIRAALADKAKWYNVDEDSSSTMNTTQGVFIITLQSQVGLTGEVTIPVLLHYELELKDPAVQQDALPLGPVQTWKEVKFIQRTDETRGQYHVDSGDALTVGLVYYIVGGFRLETHDGPEIAHYVVHWDNAALSHGFYRKIQDAVSGLNPIVYAIPTGGTFTTAPGLQIQQVLA